MGYTANHTKVRYRNLVETVRPEHIRFGAYLLMSEVLDEILNYLPYNAQVDEKFVDKTLKPVLNRTFGPMACYVMDYNGLYTLQDLGAVIIGMIKMSQVHGMPEEVTYMLNNWTNCELIYDKDPMCPLRTPYGRNIPQRHPHASPPKGRMERKDT
mgnify:CR=1 FL=1